MEKRQVKTICAAVISLAMLSGCAAGNDNAAESTDMSESTTTEAVTSEAESLTETEAPKKEYDLLNLESEEKDIIAGKLAALPEFADDLTAADIDVKAADSFEIGAEKLSGEIYRASTGKMSISEEDDSGFEQSVEAQERLCCLSGFESDRNLTEKKAVVTVEISEELEPVITDISRGYTVTDMTFNGFIRKNGSSYDVIVDPAYMIGIPIPVSSDCTYDIGGNVKLDGISFTAYSDAEISLDGDGYAYAGITADLDVTVDMNGTAKSVGTVRSAKIIDADGASRLSSGLDVQKFESKDDISAFVFSSLKENMNMFIGDDVTGVKLIDLDFDELPELLVSKKTVDENYDSWDNSGYDIDIYRFSSDGSLSFIDTLYNLNTQIYQTGNVIGLKDTGSEGKKWYYMSRYDLNDIGTRTGDAHDYLFALNGDKLEYTEVFSSKGSETQDENDIVYYFMGNEIVPEVTIDWGPYDQEEWEYYSYNGITATFGMWELFGFLREEYCSDISPVFELNSDFLFKSDDYGGKGEKLAIDERSLEYKLGYLVDSFFFGEYDESAQEYKYSFLGDYAKPVIYLYPEVETEVSVSVDVKNGAITCSYPEYRDGWKVIASPDGTLTDSNGNKYYCLYWEAKGDVQWDMSEGFVVSAADTADFLREKLLEIGLSEREANEFIIYWLPELTKDPCNLITFQTELYEENASLNITPAPDSILRVFMVYRPCSEDTVIKPQSFEKFERKGFTAVEWGGARIK